MGTLGPPTLCPHLLSPQAKTLPSSENHWGIFYIVEAEFITTWVLNKWCIFCHWSTNLSRRESDFFQWRLWQSCVRRFLWWVSDTSCLWCLQRQADLSRFCPTHTRHRRQPQRTCEQNRDLKHQTCTWLIISFNWHIYILTLVYRANRKYQAWHPVFEILICPDGIFRSGPFSVSW